jgi:hypothetical protein
MAAETPSNDTYEMAWRGLGFRFDLEWNQGVAGKVPRPPRSERGFYLSHQ